MDITVTFGYLILRQNKLCKLKVQYCQAWELAETILAEQDAKVQNTGWVLDKTSRVRHCSPFPWHGRCLNPRTWPLPVQKTNFLGRSELRCLGEKHHELLQLIIVIEIHLRLQIRYQVRQAVSKCTVIRRSEKYSKNWLPHIVGKISKIQS